MVTRSRTTLRKDLKPSTDEKKKFRITILHKIGPHINSEEGMKDRERIKRKLGSVLFAPVKVTKKGIIFEGTATIIQKLPKNSKIADIKAAYKREHPKAQIKVERMEA